MSPAILVCDLYIKRVCSQLMSLIDIDMLVLTPIECD